MTKEQYIDEHLTAGLHYWTRIVFGAGVPVILLLALLDYVATPAQFHSFLRYRLIAASILFLMYLVNRKTENRSLQSFSIVAATAVVAAMVAAMVHDFHGHESPYFAGFILVAIFSASIVPLSFRVSLLSGLLVYSFYLVPVLVYDQITNMPYFLSANILIISSIATLLLFQYFKERQIIKEFSLEYEQQAAQAALRTHERRLAESQRIAHIGSWERNLTNDEVVWSDELFHILGLDPGADNADFKIFLEIVHPDDREYLKSALRETVELQTPYGIDCRIRLKNGRNRIIHTQGELVYDDAGKPILLRGTAQDITERKRAEETLRETENRTRRIIEATPVGMHMYLLEPDGRMVFIGANPAADRLLGVDNSAFIGKTIEEAFPSLKETEVPQRYREVALTGKTWRTESIDYHEGAIRGVFEVHAFQTGQNSMVAAFEDITERKLAEEKIRKSEKFIRNILDTVDEAFIVIDRDYRIVTANKAYCLTASCDNVIGKHCYEISHRMNITCSDAGEGCTVRKVFETGRPHAAVHTHRDSDGHDITVEIKAFPIKDDSGDIISAIETINDITEKRLLEEERLKTQKLEAIGTLAGGIAHDFNNLLQGVFGYISLAKLTADRKAESIAALEQAEKALHMSVNLTSQLLTFAKGGKPVKQRIDLRPVIENAARFGLSGSRSDYLLDISKDLWNADADSGQIAQVIQNIALNADQAMPEGGHVEISAFNVQAPDNDLPQGLKDGRYVKISIKDSGVGIPEQYLTKIFDPYFTTKEKGSGLGLASSYSIIRNHGGLIDVKSMPGKGSAFAVYIPAAETAAKKPVIASVTRPTRRGRILIMDDEEVVRAVASELVRSLGHDVDLAEHGEAAILKYRAAHEAGRPFDIVILDLTIRGGMGGVETLQKLREIDPDVKAIVSSGYSDDAVTSSYHERGFNAFLKKPYNIDGLKDALNRMFNLR